MLHRRLETGTWNLLGEPSGRGKGVIYIYKALCESVSESVSNVLFVPRGTNIFHTQVRGGTNNSYTLKLSSDHRAVQTSNKTYENSTASG